jgi:acid phosphatase
LKLPNLGLWIAPITLGVLAGLAAAGLVEAREPVKQVTTRTPIKHVIVVIGENRTFDHLFGLYRPRPGQTVSNLLSKGIVNADGTPGPHFAEAAQFEVGPESSYYISAPHKTPYAVLPPPNLDATPATRRDTLPPFNTTAEAAAVEPALEPDDEILLTTGFSGPVGRGSLDTRVANNSNLPNGPFQLTGPNLPYDSYTGDTIHRFYQMWQQSACDLRNKTKTNPSGCLSDLYPFVNGSFYPRGSNAGNSMAFYNVNDGDAPYLKKLADEYTSSDNFHQSAMGGTGANHMMLAGNAIFFSDGKGNPDTPPANLIANPNPQPGTDNRYMVDGWWVNCSDPSQPGVGPILNYLRQLDLSPNCATGHFYVLNNSLPGFLPNGTPRIGARGTFVPPSNLRTIGDELLEKNISWAYYGGAFDAALRLANGSTNPADAIGKAYCQICNPFQYSSSIMTNADARKAHLKDVVDLFRDLSAGTLPSISFVKPDGMLDGHPASSKVDLFEAMLKDLLGRLHANPKLTRQTAVFITFDEGGGYYDSGYIQPLDFFGDGPRIPLIVVSQFSTGGRIVHTYYDHVSISKFIERNWMLAPLSARGRDNLPNPIADRDNPYVPRNWPAIGDLFEMFDFGHQHADHP